LVDKETQMDIIGHVRSIAIVLL